LEGIEDIGDVENFEDMEDIDDIGVEETEDVEEIEGSEAMECTETEEELEIQLGRPEIESQGPKNGKIISCNAITLPREFMATSWVQREEDAQGAIPILLADEEEYQDTGKIVFEKSTLSMCHHLKPLYIKAHMDGRPINRVLVNNGATVNILPTSMLRKLFKTKSDLIATDVLLVILLVEPLKQKGSFLPRSRLAAKWPQ
jgi:hypothetical protein